MNIIYNLNSNNTEFLNFKKTFNDWENVFDVYDRDGDEVYKRIKCVWEENGVEHQYHATINAKTGGIYLDCQRKKILAKHITLIVLRPLYTIVKTAWHASIVGPVALEIFKIATGKQSVKEGLKNFEISMLDIALTPLCGIAMTITSIVTVILSPFSPNVLYRGRDIVGYLERVMLHTEDLIDSETPCLSPCFSPLANIATIHKEWGKKDNLTKINVNSALTEYARVLINFRKHNRTIFNNCFRLHPQDQPYISSVATS